MPKMLRTKKRVFDLVFIMTFKQSGKSEEKEKLFKVEANNEGREGTRVYSSSCGSETKPVEKKLKISKTKTTHNPVPNKLYF